MTQNESARRNYTLFLSLAFATAIVMGPGPGLYLVNPDPGDPQAVFTLAGVPVLYLWVLFWFAVQAAVVLLAYFLLWRSEES